MNYAAEWETAHTARLMVEGPLQPVRDWFGAYALDGNERPKVLDIGCGAGGNALWLTQIGFKVWGFDSSSSAVKRLLHAATKKARPPQPVPQVIVSDATKRWPYNSGSFDVALEVRVLENLDEDETRFAFFEIARVLKPGGKFFSLTASEDRPDRYTRCGKVRKSNPGLLASWLEPVGLGIQSADKVFRESLEDWCIVALKA